MIRRSHLLLGAILLVSGGATVGARRQTSTTFDEIIMMAGGARGFATGKFDLVPEHPPLVQYLYGLPIFLSNPVYPPEADPAFPRWSRANRFFYSENLFWLMGNDPERVAFLGRIMGALSALALVAVTFSFARRVASEGVGLLSAGLVGFLPDVLAHGGVAYNDVPHAFMFVAGVWAIDEAVRRPSVKHGALAGGLVGLALGTKFSALVLGPVALVLLAAEGVSRWRDRAWRVSLAKAAGVGFAAVYVLLVLIYRGDPLLAQLREGLGYTLAHAREGHGIPAFLLGKTSPTVWWYFYPVAFFLKTPAALHLLAVIAVVGAATAPRGDWKALLGSRLRAPLVGAAVFGGVLIRTDLALGFRHALPVLPLGCILVAAGVGLTWRATTRRVHTGIAAVVAWYVLSSLSFYPHFLAYTSEYVPSRDQGHKALVDSSLDWGQGLLALRAFMREQGIERVYLSYFGSANPAGYGIEYVPLTSFFDLPEPDAVDDDAPAPSYAVISATNLQGIYLPNDPFAPFRDVEPDWVVAHTLFVYRLDQ